MSDAVPPAPPGFVYEKPLFAKMEGSRLKLFVWANFLALVPFGMGLALMWVPYQIYLALGAPFALQSNLQLTPLVSIISGVIIFLVSMFLHEWLHGVTLQLMGYTPIYTFKVWVLFAGLNKGDYLPRLNYLVMTLTPLVAMSIVGVGILLLLPPAYGRLLLIALLLNMAASLGDLFVAAAVWRAPKTAVFTDDNGIQMFVPK